MTAEQPYTPDKYDVCSAYVDYYMQHSSALHSEVEAEFDRWLAAHDAQIKRDAARAALDGLADDQEQFAREIPAFGGQAHRLAGAARSYRDRHYPEETP